MQTIKFPNETFDPVPRDSVSHLFYNGDPQPSDACRVRAYDTGEMLRMCANPLLIDRQIISSFVYPFQFAKGRIFHVICRYKRAGAHGPVFWQG